MNAVKLLIPILLLSLQVLACDDSLKPFARDCAIQDRYNQIKNRLVNRKTNIDEIAEYRVTRFIDRATWEWAKKYEVSPQRLYEPAPATWEVWDSGIRSIFISTNLKGSLSKDIRLSEDFLSHLNWVLLKNDLYNVKDAISDKSKKPGEFRFERDLGVGFCWNTASDNVMLIKSSESSMIDFQNQWQIKAQKKFSSFMTGSVFNSESIEPNMLSGIRVTDKKCGDGVNYVRIEYSPSNEVKQRVSWVLSFVNENLKMHEQGQAVLSPIELASVVQKWLVSIHPFSDGNGRTSRAVQDLILAHFGLPFAPSGDLQNDALSQISDYTSLTYSKIEDMLNSLETCTQKIEKEWALAPRPFECRVLRN